MRQSSAPDGAARISRKTRGNAHGWRRRAHPRAARRRGVRAGGRQFLARAGQPAAAQRHRAPAGAGGGSFIATGVSLVLHPQESVRADRARQRALLRGQQGGVAPVWWFGGGFDLTPFYPRGRGRAALARVARDAVRAVSARSVYPRYKQWCDEYFYLKHRDETRGVGGLFFDDLNEGGFERCFAFTRDVGEGFLAAYLPIVERRKDTPYGEREREFQLYRRGRYVEFNLVYDRGTLFGLQSGGRTESILMSLPPRVRFEYAYQPGAGLAGGAAGRISAAARLGVGPTPRQGGSARNGPVGEAVRTLWRRAIARRLSVAWHFDTADGRGSCARRDWAKWLCRITFHWALQSRRIGAHPPGCRRAGDRPPAILAVRMQISQSGGSALRSGKRLGGEHVGGGFRGLLPMPVSRPAWPPLAYGVAPLNFTTVAPCTGPICALSLTFSTTARRNSRVPCTTACGPMMISGGVVSQ